MIVLYIYINPFYSTYLVIIRKDEEDKNSLD